MEAFFVIKKSISFWMATCGMLVVDFQNKLTIRCMMQLGLLG